ncbi:class I SAM-dependent methyltransferase [Longirhabdus pacifica]|uniref:class I SAM-dependent methyltransferase n=1 Tax=Longirhabdus pacifica TaxID=2305227 RepID=UPI001008BD3A|nr:class I SAM-dependent methyltransferase [Longirhabdus pacifica]
MFIATDWKDYELVDTGNGEKCERWGNVKLRRPEPQAIWPIENEKKHWTKVDAHYHRSTSGGGHWEYHQTLPERWTVQFGDLSFYIKPTNFKHTGLFPEQAANWTWIINKIKNANRPIKVLNLFAYTGGASVAAASAGAEVCHVDASKGMVQWAKENLHLSGLGDRKVRFLVDDVFKFVQREIRRGNHYDAIIMDPPSYGRGPNGEVWKLETHLYEFIQTCMNVLSDDPLFMLVNSYTTGISPQILNNIMTQTMSQTYKGTLTTGEIGLPITASQLVLPCGIVGRWES